ncbi:MAG TPA: gamma-glutamyl-gamma-aminobutyrate hydrolase family protein [Acidimicrobiia bacterium]|nr:gamma-glutamyl-gamma-aminobutyrate hydrolase family protein [Acidimicrobiia bacterium]
MRVTVIRNDPYVPPGHLARVCRERGHDVDVVALDAGESLPPIGSVSAIAVLGGEMGAYDTDIHPYLETEKSYLADAVERGIPVLGLCLGCQLLADALGGAAYMAPAPEATFDVLDVVAEDAVVGILGSRPSLALHRDTWALPPGARLIARSGAYLQAFRMGSALGIQTHPEVTPAIVADWLADQSGQDLVISAGASPKELLEAIAAASHEIAVTADEVFGSWLDESERAVENRSEV